ncbi:MAG: tellurite resistance TerB family protein, partial [Rhodospirillales bacterium]
ALGQIEAALPAKLRETAYALACDVAAADGRVDREELRMLEIIRDRLAVDRLVAVAIERAAGARFATFSQEG